MKQEIFINSSPQESRIAIMEDGALAEFLIERKEERGIAGNIYKGKIERVLPGMQAAFVDIGMDKAAFLHASDFFSVPEDVQLISPSGDDVEFDDVPKPAPNRRLPLEKQEAARALRLKIAQDGVRRPVQVMEGNYDLSSYIGKGQGNVDSDVNIAKLALALEIDAAVGYVSDAVKLKSPYMVELEAGIACIEAIHAARIRAAFNSLGIKIPVVPSALISTSDRDNWVIKVDRAVTSQ